MLSPTILASAGCGLLGHLAFNKLEPRSGLLILALLFLPPALIIYSFSEGRFTLMDIVIPYLRSLGVHLGTLCLSVIAYRVSPLHPLAEYPGPLICKISKLWAAYITSTGKQHIYYKQLHDQYGPYVRTGPNNLHICDAGALPEVMAAKPFIRAERYRLLRVKGSRGSVLSITDPDEHAQRRKIWERGLNISAVQEYSDSLSARIQQLLSVLEKRIGKDVDISGWFSCLSFDFMGDLAFGGAFHLLDAGEDVNTSPPKMYLASLRREVMITLPWFEDFGKILRINKPARAVHAFAKQSVLNRKEHGSTKKDLFYYLLDEAGLGTEPPSLPTLTNESTLAIIAGSDTTGTALSNIFYFLLLDPEAYARLQSEIDREFSKDEDIFSPTSNTRLRSMQYLNAVINETLRLCPAVPNGIQRYLPKGTGGILLGKRVIPDETTVQISAYSVHRNPKYFSPEPMKWKPERWVTKDLGHILDQAAFFPFSYGPTNCVGKNLALYELRTTICSVLQRFEVKSAPAFDASRWNDDLRDHSIYVKGELPTRIELRK